MVEVSIYPPGAGTVTAEVIPAEFSWSDDLGLFTITFKGEWVKLTATPNDGYYLESFSWDQLSNPERYEFYGFSYVTPSRQIEPIDHWPWLDTRSPTSGFLTATTPYFTDTHLSYANIRALFAEKTKFNVSISANPQSGGNVSGGGEFSEGSSCTLTASRNDGFELMRLENAEDGITIYPPNPPQCFGKTISHTFSVTKDSSWVAHFRQCTNQILRGLSGNILRGSGGDILRDW